jgi:hypothetical protein
MDHRFQLEARPRGAYVIAWNSSPSVDPLIPSRGAANGEACCSMLRVTRVEACQREPSVPIPQTLKEILMQFLPTCTAYYFIRRRRVLLRTWLLFLFFNLLGLLVSPSFHILFLRASYLRSLSRALKSTRLAAWRSRSKHRRSARLD